MNNVLGLILGGGRGTRLFPLTINRAKPAVPIAGKYRLIDIPMSNCLNAGINKIAILTQFNSVSLHRHITNTYQRDIFSDGWVQILAAEQTPNSDGWYQGTADAVRQQFVEIKNAGTKYVLILAGDHLYQMDYKKFVDYHIDNGADITLAVQPVPEKEAPELGILKRADNGKIVDFKEKPNAELLPDLQSLPGTDKPYMASMGIYVFSVALLEELLNSDADDFGKDIIPNAINNKKVMGYIFDDYWADIGTIRRFYEVNLELASPQRPFSFISSSNRTYTRPRFLPPAEISNVCINEVLLTDGCKIADSSIEKSVIGLRSIICKNAVIKSTILMGADMYESDSECEQNEIDGIPNLGIGEGSTIEAAIIDKNARIGKNVQIKNDPDRPDAENDNWYVREGLVIVRKDGIIADGTVI
ncbi:MAG: glucose-1-phosphate adenylyltransferase [Melioribacteraceae bacterium]|nr:glucose-1-phosphate adenylyltransferase [Melioribacteraceae bacterium]